MKGIAVAEKDVYSRQRIIPHWDQKKLENQKIFVVGLGGNGSEIFSALVAMGTGKLGWIKACDPDVLEMSNLSRISYATPRNIGVPKSRIAQNYASCRAPHGKITCFHESITTKQMIDMAKEAHVLFGTVDNDGARKILNSICIRYCIPMIDIATEIIPGKQHIESVGQVRCVIPGVTGCLICSGSIDLTEAALDLLPEAQKKERAKVGYVRGTDETPTPSVIHLNGVASYLGISQFIRLVFGENISQSAFLHYDREKCQIMKASVEPNPSCPVCGKDGYLGKGDSLDGIQKEKEDVNQRTFQFVNGEKAESEQKKKADDGR